MICTLSFATHVAWRRGTCAGVMLAVLAGCGGGGGGATTPVTQDPGIPGPSAPVTDPDTPVPRTTSGLRDGATDLLDVWAGDGGVNYTALGVVPAGGTASYAGYLYGDLSSDGGDVADSLVGRLTLSVAFGPETADVSGSATDFVDGGDDFLSGTLTVSGGSFNRNGNPASDATLRGVAVDGVLQDGDGTDWTVGLRLEGDFLGDTAEAVGGEAIGGVTVGTTARDFDGGFIAAE